ncbi:NTF2-like domain-containing protein [Desulfonema limicola]|uniref:NTF2-like domain-containing protein n=1 Tax=Desulfonema limicola TaxID=45656 RepID=A0A975BCE3_9BACT|nr:nuclear transport factor 2 family protein [Desulfonema limicola]QTA82763.1 NTF2-like domain-containing protein [Desulfonema limicola]
MSIPGAIISAIGNKIKKNEDNIFKSLPKKIHPLFRDFRDAYNSKDINLLNDTISDNYTGNYFNLRSKKAFINTFKNMFKAFPFGVNPKLTIKVHHAVDGDDECVAIVTFKSNIGVAGIPTKSFESGKVTCIAKPEGKYGRWKIASIYNGEG